jgi:hypothetical protein
MISSAAVLFLVAGATAASAGPSAVPTRLSAILKPSPNQEFRRARARGSFKAVYSPSARTLRFRLTYSGLSGPVRVAEIHIGKLTRAGLTDRYPICTTNYVPCAPGKWLTTEQVAPELMVELGRRSGYIDLHTLKNTAGEAAGKLRVGK